MPPRRPLPAPATVELLRGLAVGMAACLLILLFIKDELGYDRYNKNFGRIQRVTTFIRFGAPNNQKLAFVQAFSL